MKHKTKQEIQPGIILLLITFTICMIVVMSAIFLGLYISSIPLTPIKQLGCDKLINQSYTNGSIFGYQLGVIDTSNFVLKNGLLPVFINNSGVIEMKYLNLTKEVKQNGKS